MMALRGRWTVWWRGFAAVYGVLLVLTVAVFGQSPKGGGGRLKVYFVDVEGGQATLFVTPAGRSMLIDAGWPDSEHRDADRIAAAVKSVGLKKIDYVLMTHFREDRVGGLPQLLDRIPVGALIDPGPSLEGDRSAAERGAVANERLTATGTVKRIVARPGDVLPIVGMKATVVSADGDLIKDPLNGGGETNPYCSQDSETKPAEESESARSVGVQIVFGKLKLLDMGDLTWDKETALMCPVNRLGTADVLIVARRGWEQSTSPMLVNGLTARIEIVAADAKKGGSAEIAEVETKATGLETLWQMHYSEEAGADHNTAEEYIANPQGMDGEHLELIGSGDGSFDVVNSRTKASKHYAVLAGR